MAVLDTSKKPFIQDRDDNIYIGIDLPFRKSESGEGYFASTSTTIDAVKNNVRTLLSTDKGERIFQPNLGVDLRRFIWTNNWRNNISYTKWDSWIIEFLVTICYDKRYRSKI